MEQIRLVDVCDVLNCIPVAFLQLHELHTLRSTIGVFPTLCIVLVHSIHWGDSGDRKAPRLD